MIHYTCDGCGRTIDSCNEMRHVVRVEVYAALDPSEDELDDDRDHLQEIQDLLERLDDDEDSLGQEVYHQQRYDLCGECRRRYVKNPLGRLAPEHFGFSQN
ncbi:MAG: hypothetical protein CMJ58_23025 [Planctomycetaceae bacterium]|nr:hypothetical protein [Planctomycetaceae bacterium]